MTHAEAHRVADPDARMHERESETELMDRGDEMKLIEEMDQVKGEMLEDKFQNNVVGAFL